jgi:hypothetical protein
VGRRLVINVQWPKGTDWEHCVRGEEVEEAVEAASMPPAYATFQLKPDASTEDAKRIADCIRNHLGEGSGTVTVREVDGPPE